MLSLATTHDHVLKHYVWDCVKLCLYYRCKAWVVLWCKFASCNQLVKPFSTISLQHMKLFFLSEMQKEKNISLLRRSCSTKKIIRKLWKILSRIAHAQRLKMLRKVQIWLQYHTSQHKSNSKRVLQKMFLKNLGQRFTVLIREDYLEILEYSLCLFLETGDKISLVHLRDLWICCVFGG